MREVDHIVWSHKLAPETINLAATKSVAEIQVIRVALRAAELDREVLRAIDQAIPFPLIFELTHGGRLKLAAAHKRPSEADSSRWVVGDYFESGWLPDTAPRAPMPVALDMGALYERLLGPLVLAETEQLMRGMGQNPPARSTAAPEAHLMSLEACIMQAEAIKAQIRRVDLIKARLGRERQFNKRIALNAQLREARRSLDSLLRPEKVSDNLVE